MSLTTFRLFHVTDNAANLFSERAAEAFPQDYVLVATIEIPTKAITEFGIEAGLGQVYGMTQHGEEPWTSRSDISLPPADALKVVEALAANAMANSSVVLGRRSTSVGDVIEVNGDRYVVAGLGFKVLPKATANLKAMARRRFNRAVTVTRLVNTEDQVRYDTSDNFGKTMVANQNGFYLAVYTDLAGNSYRLDPDAAKLVFIELDKAWETDDEAVELPTTDADRDYRGYDYMAIGKDGKLRAYMDAINDEESLAVETVEQFLHLAQQNDHHVLFSSSVYHADEYTSDPAVLALCAALRS